MACLMVFVGIDVSRDWLDVHIHLLRQDLRVANTKAGWQELAEHLAQYPNATVAAEASGGYEKGVLRYLDAAGLDTHCLDAARVRQFARAAGRRAKNDCIDARVIAHFIATFPLTPARFEAAIERLAEHVTYRRQLVEQRVAVANQARMIRDPKLARLSRSHIRQLDQAIARLDRRLVELIAADPALSAKAAVLLAVKGVGPTLAATLLALLPELGTVCRRAIAALVGVCPYDFESGKFQGQRHIAGGCMPVRNALYMPILVAIRHNPGLKAFYERCRENRGKPQDGKEQKKPAVIAAMRKFLTILNAKMRDHLIERRNNPETAIGTA